MERWQLENRIEKIINRNCVEIPWEGTEVDKSGLREDIIDLIDEIKRESLKEFMFGKNLLNNEID